MHDVCERAERSFGNGLNSLYKRPIFAFLYTNEASGIIPTASVVVKTIRVNMNHLVLGQICQLQSSADFITWTNFAASFPVTNSSSYQDVCILGTANGFFRVVERQ
jgi:hypothetical protein